MTVDAGNISGQNFASCSTESWCPQFAPAHDALNGVWGSGASDVWAVGDNGSILHWNGSVWTSVTSGTTSYLLAVWGSGASDVWAVGGRDCAGTILHWNGSAWSSVTNDTTDVWTGVWGSGPSDVWAVGVLGTSCTGTAAPGRA